MGLGFRVYGRQEMGSWFESQGLRDSWGWFQGLGLRDGRGGVRTCNGGGGEVAAAVSTLGLNLERRAL